MEGLNFETKRPEVAEQKSKIESRAEKTEGAEKKVRSLFDNRMALEKIVAHLQDKPVFEGFEQRG